MRKRIISLLLAAICILPLAVTSASAEVTSADTTASGAEDTSNTDETASGEELPTGPLTVDIQNVGAACVYNIENDRYIYDLDADKQIYPASTVKLMTAIIAFETFKDDLQHKVSVQAPAIIRVSGNKLGLKYDEQVPVEELLYAVLVGNYNDAANVLAMEIGGTIEDFVVMMNEKAKELGAENTFYTNPTGMHDPAMVTTARDTAIIASYACRITGFLDMTSVEKHVMPPTNKAGTRTYFNRNYYFSTSMEYLYIWKVPRGMNAGYTDEGGYCIATTATRDGLTYVVIVMGAVRDSKYIYSYTEAAKLIKWAFDAYSYTKLLTTADMICEIPVRLASKVDYVTLFPSQNIELYLPTGLDLENDVKIEWSLDEETLTAPISDGQVVGKLNVSYDGIDLGTYDLITRNSVNRNNILYVFDLIRGALSGSWFRVVLIIAAAAFIVYIGGIILISLRMKQLRAGADAKRKQRMPTGVKSDSRPNTPPRGGRPPQN